MDNDPQYRTNDGSALRIWRDTVKNNFLSEREGRPIFDDAIFVEVISPGSRGSTPVFEVKRKFAPEMARMEPLLGMQYEQFKEFIKDFEKNEEADATLTGTPLKEWPEISRTMAAALRASNVFSVDALAELPDEKLSLVGPDGRTWREKAKAFIAAAKDGSFATKLAADLETANTAIQDLKDQVAQMAAQNAVLQQQIAGNVPAPETVAAPAPAAKTGKAAAPIADIV